MWWHTSFMSCWPHTSGCVKKLYNWHTEKEGHANVSVICCMYRFITLCVTDPIWGVCCNSYKYTGPSHGSLFQIYNEEWWLVLSYYRGMILLMVCASEYRWWFEWDKCCLLLWLPWWLHLLWHYVTLSNPFTYCSACLLTLPLKLRSVLSLWYVCCVLGAQELLWVCQLFVQGCDSSQLWLDFVW